MGSLHRVVSFFILLWFVVYLRLSNIKPGLALSVLKHAAIAGVVVFTLVTSVSYYEDYLSWAG